MQDTLQRISKSAVALACLNSVKKTQVVPTCQKLLRERIYHDCLYVGMLPSRSTVLDRCTTMHLRHQPLELATKLFNSTLISSVSGADGMDPELHWYGCHPGNTDLVDLASGGMGKTSKLSAMQSVGMVHR